MFKKKILSFLVLFAICFFLGMAVAVNNANAAVFDTVKGGMGTFVDKVWNPQGDTPDMTVQDIIARVVNTFLSLLGVIFLIIIIYAGFLWMTAGGNDEQVTKAKKWLTNSVIGVIIVIAAYAISYFVLNALLE